MWKALVLHVCRLSLLGLVATIHATCVLKPITGDDAEFCCDDLHVVHPDIGDVACKSILHCDNVSQRLLKDGGAPVVTYQKAQKQNSSNLHAVFKSCYQCSQIIAGNVIEGIPPIDINGSYAFYYAYDSDSTVDVQLSCTDSIQRISGSDKMYSLLMMDPDAPSRESPGNKYWNHWVIADIQETESCNLIGRKRPRLLLEEFTILAPICEYKGPSPPANTGFHRYQFFLYLQPPGSRPSLLPSEEKSRGKFNPEAFALRFGLGKAVATTQYMVRNPQQKDL